MALLNLLALFGGVESAKLMSWASWHEYSLESRLPYFQIGPRPCVRPRPAWQEARRPPASSCSRTAPYLQLHRALSPHQPAGSPMGRPPKWAL